MQTQQAHSMRHAWQGSFVLPQVDAAVPHVLSKGGERSTVLARFSRAAAAVGVPLPEGSFSTIEQVVQAQWAQYAATKYPEIDVPGVLAVVAHDDRLSVIARPVQTLDIFDAKPLVESLELAAPGLGWFVYSCLTQAHAHGVTVYDLEMACSHFLHMHGDLESFTDEAYVEHLRDYEGIGIENATPEVIERLKEDFSHFPSDLLKDVDGHAHLLGWSRKRPKHMTRREASMWLSENEYGEHAATVRAALELDKAWARDRECAFNLSSLYDPEGYEEYPQSVGAVCWMTWGRPSWGLLSEAIEHYETDAYNAGCAVECFGVASLAHPDDTSDGKLRKFALQTAQYLERMQLLSQLLAFFPRLYDEEAA